MIYVFIFTCILLYDPDHLFALGHLPYHLFFYVACTRRHPPPRLSFLLMLAGDETLMRSGICYLVKSYCYCHLLSYVCLFSNFLRILLSVFYVARTRNGIAIFLVISTSAT
jgi:hypothetical protein